LCSKYGSLKRAYFRLKRKCQNIDVGGDEMVGNENTNKIINQL
jgi:hypothetical protein